MLKAALDTSVLVSVFIKHDGVNARVLQKAKDKYHLYLSEHILKETTEVLLTFHRIRKKYLYSDDEAREYLANLRIVARRVLKKLPEIKVIEEDPKDDPVLASALKAKADYLVSKDEHLRKLKEYRGIKIVSSHEFLEIIDKTHGSSLVST